MAHAQRGPEGFLTEVCRGLGDHLRVGKHLETSLEELNKISVDLGGSLRDRINGLTNCFCQIVTLKYSILSFCPPWLVLPRRCTP